MLAATIRTLSSLLWWTLLLLPAVTVFTTVPVWDVSPYGLIAVTVWCIAVIRLLAGPRWFLLASWPLAFIAAVMVGADLLRNVNLMELAMVGALRADEAAAAIGPYLLPCAAAAAALLAVAVVPLFLRQPAAPAARIGRLPGLAALALAGVALAVLAPGFLRAWPLNLMSMAAAKMTGREDLLSAHLPYAQINPRDPAATWRARLKPGMAAAGTYVLVIGESVRADRLGPCGSNRPIGPASPEALVYCNVISGASSTHASVPLLLSREIPGGALRVTSDATMARAFEEVGFETWWVSVQENQIAWPDTRHVQYTQARGSDKALLTGPLKLALQAPGAAKLIVLHAYNAHFNYCERYERSRARWPVDCAALGDLASAPNRAALRDAYDNAVDESMRFLDDVIAITSEHAPLAMVVYTSDHGENLYDDQRELFQHALSIPTRWDIRVPAIFWASAAWRQSNAARWKQLQANVASPLMHGDVVPTMLGAAGIDYEEPRRDVADLGTRTPPSRVRWVQRRLGAVVDGDSL